MRAFRMMLILLAFFLSPLTPSANTDHAEMIESGRALFEEGRCMACHEQRPFGRENSKLKSFPSLTTMVEACNTNLGLGWFPDEVEAVSHYLNHRFYGFELTAPAEASNR